MTSRQAPAPVDLTSFAALVGIDWADQKHDVALCAAGSDRVELRQIDHTAEALDEWATELRRRFDGLRPGSSTIIR